MKYVIGWAMALLPLVNGCDQAGPGEPPLQLSEEFSAYWFNGQAELTSYTLEQARYGEVHPGEAVLIFVTEDFSRSKHVKLDYPQEAGADVSKVLKLNATRKFYTGVYPYSMMASVFTPLNYRPGSTHKVTASSQEWCGHTFAQLNNRGSALDISLKSYFESEGDVEVKSKPGLMEDELWNTIRLDPTQLPVGTFDMVPSLLYARLSHDATEAITAEGNLTASDSVSIYHLEYPGTGRKLSIRFDTGFPYEILGWEESYTSGFGENARVLTTRAVKKAQVRLDYWSKNSLADSVWRNRLSLQ